MTKGGSRRVRTRHLAALAATLAAVSAMVLPVPPAQAAAGDVDPDFSGDGIATVELDDRQYGTETVVLDDGSILVGGGAFVDRSRRGLCTRALLLDRRARWRCD